ncbi:hypothetical protein BASA50_008094 [Batrachochytrium salamandrivorans]|uniref:Secreted protein n=1 Tax=Batrachochytrium salamandrivorans TaxID=1357716 RepID=A0ABQ8F595_9FUNG|nr:hypothetical protein BASA50_008094 [Batrachochytrium salamandrivorans]
MKVNILVVAAMVITSVNALVISAMTLTSVDANGGGGFLSCLRGSCGSNPKPSQDSPKDEPKSGVSQDPSSNPSGESKSSKPTKKGPFDDLRMLSV